MPIALAKRQSGLALVVVLWSMAALGMLSATLMLTARNEVQYQQVVRDQAQAVAVADGAINVVAAWVAANPDEASQGPDFEIEVGGTAVNVVIRPATSFIDINRAERAVIESLLTYVADFSADQAEGVAEEIIRHREGDLDADIQARPFGSIEDLRQIPAITPEVFDTIANAITANMGAERVNATHATPAVLRALSGGDQAVVEQILNERSDPNIAYDDLVRGLDRSLLTQTGSSVYRIDALIPAGEGRQFRRVAWIDFSLNWRSLYPWHIMRTEQLRSESVAQHRFE